MYLVVRNGASVEVSAVPGRRLRPPGVIRRSVRV